MDDWVGVVGGVGVRSLVTSIEAHGQPLRPCPQPPSGGIGSIAPELIERTHIEPTAFEERELEEEDEEEWDEELDEEDFDEGK